jgi:murein DD-endopeptidase MepM/ murein hydrolase activator NlpD
MPKRYINFLVVPEGSPKSLKFRLSYLATWLILGLVTILLFFVIFFSIIHGKLLYQVLAGNSLKQENERLKRYNATVVELEKELAEYKNFVQRVAELAGVEYEGRKTNKLAYHMDPDSDYSEKIGEKEGEAIPPSTREQEKKLPFVESITTPSDSLVHIPMGTPIEGWATRGFSMNTPQFGGAHPGIDFAAKIGTKVKATADGKVILAGWDDTYGNLVGIDHGNGYVTYYGHNLKNLVNVGDSVHRGEVIALSGNSGRSSAPHLHYEIRKDGVPIDPKDFLNQR